jgi:hypothetical protein
MSAAPNSSPAPGAGPEMPLRAVQAAPGARLASQLDLAFRLAAAVYAVIAAWQVAKSLGPALHRAAAPRAELPALPPALARSIYDDTR